VQVPARTTCGILERIRQNPRLAQPVGYFTLRLLMELNGAKWPGVVLSPSVDPKAWDSGSVYSPSVIYDGSNFELWYTGLNESKLMPQIGFATSPDGANWTRASSNPVLSPGVSGSWDSAGVEQPNVIVDGTRYLLYYDGFSNVAGGRIGLAQSVRTIAVPEFPVSPIYADILLGLVLCGALCFIRRKDDSRRLIT
jgi:hypothetical protein